MSQAMPATGASSTTPVTSSFLNRLPKRFTGGSLRGEQLIVDEPRGADEGGDGHDDRTRDAALDGRERLGVADLEVVEAHAGRHVQCRARAVDEAGGLALAVLEHAARRDE